MTEEEWLKGDLKPMLGFLYGRVTKRKRFLYAAAGLRRIEHLLYNGSSQKVVAIAERAAEGEAAQHEIEDACWCAECPTFGYDFDSKYILERKAAEGKFASQIIRLMEMGVYGEDDIRGEDHLGEQAIRSSLCNAAHIAHHTLYIGYIDESEIGEHMVEHICSQDQWPGGWLIREIFGNPFRPVIADAEWLTPTVVAIAHSLYADRAFDRLPILADALEEAGCTNADLLLHCRQPREHIRGCWAVDLVLGKK